MTAPTIETIRQAVIECVQKVAPEADFATVAPAKSLREQLDLDSFDYLNVLIALHAKLGVDIPEADYGKVQTLNSLLEYLAARTSAR